jgi:fructose-1,6-bisphosphatase/inositol monophosphatase family enzyme
MSPDLRKVVADSAAHAFDVMPIPRCAAEHYAMLCRGQHQVAMFQRTLPWDHAAGALLLTEAGGQVSRWDGTPYRFHDDALGIIAASSPDLWRTAIATIIDGNGQLAEARTLTPQPSL